MHNAKMELREDIRMSSQKLWGIHMPAEVDTAPIDNHYVGIGWAKAGDLSSLSAEREAFKQALSQAYPDAKDGTIRVWAGTMYRFTHEISVGDLVVYPSKQDRMVNIGRITSDCQYVASDEHPNQRKVEWLGHFPRDEFSQAALYEIGSAVTLFQVRSNAAEFLKRLNPESSLGAPEPTIEDDASASSPEDDDTVTREATNLAKETTNDFIIKRLKNGLSDYDFEHFVAHILECLGYHARVTAKSGDGGVDVIAHRDELGFEPPIIKVQCKQITDTTGEPDVNQLLGTIGDGEYALFVNLGSYSKPARATERNKSKLRLIDGEQLVEIILENYHKLAPRYRTLLPLRQIYVADVAATRKPGQE